MSGHLNNYSTSLDGLNNRFRLQGDFYFYNTVNIRYSFRNQEALQFTLSRGTISAETNFSDWERLRFDNSFNTAMLSADFNLLRLFGPVPATYSLYGTLGVGVLRKQVDVFPFANDLPAEDQIDELRGTDMLYSFGAGFRVKLISNVDLFIQYNLTRTTSDFFDRSYISNAFETDFNSISNTVSILETGIQFRLYPAREARRTGRPPQDRYIPELGTRVIPEIDHDLEQDPLATLNETAINEEENINVEPASEIESNEHTEPEEKEASVPLVIENEPVQQQEVPADTLSTRRTHTVAAGETLFRIGRIYDMPYRDIMEINAIDDPSELYVGQILFLDRDDIPSEEISQPEQTTDLPETTQQRTHTVQPGENLYRIGVAYNVPWQQIAIANNLGTNPVIEVGQVLIIP